MKLKLTHRSNYIFGSLSGALPFLGGWLAGASGPLSLSGLLVPLFVTFYMWHWQKIHFAFIIKKYEADYEKIGYKIDPTLNEHKKFHRSLIFFIFLNGISILLFFSVIFDIWEKLTQKIDRNLYDLSLDYSVSGENQKNAFQKSLSIIAFQKIYSIIQEIQKKLNMTNFVELVDNFERKSGIPKYLIFGAILYVTCFRYFLILNQMRVLTRGYLTSASSFKQFEQLRLLNYKAILHFFMQIYLLYKLQFVN